MNIETHTINNIKIAEVTSEDIIINSAEDGLDLLGNLYYQEFDKIIVYEKNITPNFFDLKTGIAGEILQKFSNYRIPLAIIGDFDKYESKSIKDFIFESNKSKHINFVNTLADALHQLTT
ncbi:DUF4180 domain-containing protein [Pedobacter polaris]|uniref:DUF4180 domain-containing protein n=1 Tax=Pedobacter polaris TaxID=2571273 RepID=A0A4U1CKV4_9SPHI|nr:DUF4180 domain-containing protein [Pedobacter polaris]TKC08280.1 DUF4180 domain-containing protein [Pedobacter polaris]